MCKCDKVEIIAQSTIGIVTIRQKIATGAMGDVTIASENFNNVKINDLRKIAFVNGTFPVGRINGQFYLL